MKTTAVFKLSLKETSEQAHEEYLRFNMLYFTKYAEEKFALLNRHRIFITREQIEETLKLPDKTAKKGAYLSARKDGLKVVYKKESGVVKVMTFYPVKEK